MNDILILGIETSCDETGIAIFSSKQGIIAEKLHSQIAIHQKYGGVVPELASRDHISRLQPLVQEILTESNLSKNQINLIAYTRGPGLVGALMIGASFAKALGFAWGCPTLGIHHLEAHILAAKLADDKLEFPFLALLVSGGHTMLLQANGLGDYKILGQTLDDAAGEAFDKTAKMLSLGYPGGPLIEKYAKDGDLKKYNFPRPMLKNKKTLDFSFSGLKTHVFNTIKSIDNITEQDRANIACGIQSAIVDSLLGKAKLAIDKTGVNKLVIAGGVGANTLLREKVKDLENEYGITTYFPEHKYCTDNGAMVAYTGYLHYIQNKNVDTNLEINVMARWPLD